MMDVKVLLIMVMNMFGFAFTFSKGYRMSSNDTLAAVAFDSGTSVSLQFAANAGSAQLS